MSTVHDIVLDTVEGPIKVKALRYIQDRSLTIWLDEDHLETPEQVQAHEDAATEIAILIAKEVQSMTGVRLGLPEVMQPSHYAMEAPPDVWVDTSLGTPELETDNPNKAEVWLRLPEVIQGLQDDIDGLKERQVALVGLMEAQGQALGLVPRTQQPPDISPDIDFEVAYQ